MSTRRIIRKRQRKNARNAGDGLLAGLGPTARMITAGFGNVKAAGKHGRINMAKLKEITLKIDKIKEHLK
jgi:hypothetical protein